MAWYKAGTVKADKGSAVITGTGTLWADNKQGIGPGQMMLIPGSGTLQAYEILRVNSNTSITLASNFSGTSITASAYAILSFYVDSYPDFNRRLAAQLGYFQNLLDDIQEVMTGTGTVSITSPDGRIVNISSFLKLTNDMESKASLVSGAVPINQGGTGATSAVTALSNLGAAPKASPTFTGAVTASTINLSGNASVLGSGQNIIFRIDATDIASISGSGIYTNSSIDARGCYKSRRGQGGDLGANYWSYFWDGSDIRAYVDTSNLGALAFKPASDALLKKEKVYQDTESYLSEVLEWRPATFKYIERGVIPESDTVLGFIANDLVKVSPECVTGEGLKEGFDPLNPDGAYGLDQIAMIAKLTGAIHAQQAQIDEIKKELIALNHS